MLNFVKRYKLISNIKMNNELNVNSTKRGKGYKIEV